MRWGLARACGLALALAATGCAAADVRVRERREVQTRNIVDDAIAYNEAYSGAINGQILLNVLRAYNRQPRQYMSMSGFSNASPGTRSGGVSVGGIPLDQLGERWGEGGFAFGAEQRLAPDYTVQPFGTEEFAQIALEPTSPEVFHQYWHSGWNRDVLLLLLVERMDIATAAGVESFYNSAGTIDNDCDGAQYDFGGCRFVRAVRDLAQATRGAPNPVPPSHECVPSAAYGDVSRAPAASPAPFCQVMILVGERRYTLSLRSLDGMVYYVGELLRQNELSATPRDGDALVARLGVIGPGYYRAEDRVPLFRIAADVEDERGYAATVTYGGRRYSAGAPMDRFCYDPPPGEGCRGGTLRGDRSGTVLELLASVLAYNQNEAAVTAPESAIINAR